MQIRENEQQIANKAVTDAQHVLGLGAYDLFAYLGKKVINPGGITGRHRLLTSVSIKPGARVLEVGCGTGHAACDIARKYKCHVTAVDISKEMVATAKQVIRSQKLESSVTCEVADILNLPYEEGSFDVVLAQAVLMFVDEKKALEQVRRVLKDGAEFAALEFCWKKKPDNELRDCTYDVCGCNDLHFHHHESWRQKLVNAEFNKATSVPYKFDMLSVRGFLRDEGFLNAMRVAGKIFSGKANMQRTWEIWRHFSDNLDYYEYTILRGEKAIRGT